MKPRVARSSSSSSDSWIFSMSYASPGFPTFGANTMAATFSGATLTALAMMETVGWAFANQWTPSLPKQAMWSARRSSWKSPRLLQKRPLLHRHRAEPQLHWCACMASSGLRKCLLQQPRLAPGTSLQQPFPHSALHGTVAAARCSQKT